MSGHIMREKLRGNKRIPLVLMLEPLHACNLTCEGCGRIIEYKDSMTDRMSLEQCFEAAEVTRAPVVSVCGGEPLIYREIDALIDGLIERGKYIYLCTNAMFLDRFLPKHEPCEQLSITVHMDGMRELHDKIVERQGVWDPAKDEHRIRVATSDVDGAVRICVADTGTGIPPELQKRIFEPFFTTKEQGTGLGLAISREIIERFGGRMELSSRPGEGTSFAIVLPAVRAELPGDPRSSRDVKRSGQRRKAALWDDDDSVAGV